MQIESFEPIVDEKSTVLILGTMPGVASLKAKQYYGHPDNLFWDIVFRVCSQEWKCDEVVYTDYETKQKLLSENNIALWDVLKFCDRKGSLDRAILNQIHNDFKSFFAKYPNINKVFFNGKVAAEYFKEFKNEPSIFFNRTFTTLQSTSPSNTTNSFYILNQWKQIIK
ncbi:MAG: DNA-deoxyinosine glycosylase [Taibaiella sp.]|jgi:hypoxanthine-DNA glycosylase